MKTFFTCLALLLVSATASAEKYPDGYADDRAAIIDLQNRYVIAMDYFDADGYAAVFAENGVLDWARGEVIGREAIREFMSSGTYDLRTMGFQPATTPDGREWPSTVRHLVTNQVIRRRQQGESHHILDELCQQRRPSPDSVAQLWLMGRRIREDRWRVVLHPSSHFQ